MSKQQKLDLFHYEICSFCNKTTNRFNIITYTDSKLGKFQLIRCNESICIYKDRKIDFLVFVIHLDINRAIFRTMSKDLTDKEIKMYSRGQKRW